MDIDAINATDAEVNVPLLQRWLASESDPNDPKDESRENVAVSQSAIRTLLQELGYSRQESKPGFSRHKK